MLGWATSHPRMGVLVGDTAGSRTFSSKAVLQFVCSKGESAGGHRKRRNKEISLSVVMVCAEVLLAAAEQ